MNNRPAIQMWLPVSIEGEVFRDELKAKTPTDDKQLMERVVEKDNLYKALKQVERNGGSPGVDEMTTKELSPYLKQHWPRLKETLLQGAYIPQPVKRVKIPKPGREEYANSGIPTVTDRFIQQAILQILQPEWDTEFSKSGFGFRPNRSAHQAVMRAQKYTKEGYTWVVDIDVEKFFDRVNHDKLMSEEGKGSEDFENHPTISESWSSRTRCSS